MEDEQQDQINQEQAIEPQAGAGRGNEDVPSGIARLREEWVKLGLVSSGTPKDTRIELEPVIFPEPVGDYHISSEEARARLGLSVEAMDRLLGSGELDSIQVRFPDGIRRMISESALTRFISDSGLDEQLAGDLIVPPAEMRTALDEIRDEIREMKEAQTRQLQQFKDILLLELRNLKEQDLDMASFVFDLTAGLEELNPKLKKRRRTSPEKG